MMFLAKGLDALDVYINKYSFIEPNMVYFSNIQYLLYFF